MSVCLAVSPPQKYINNYRMVFFFNDILHRKSPEDESPDLFSSATMRLIFLVQSEIS